MNILALRILPPLAIARFGSSPTALEAFDLAISSDAPMDYRRIVPMPTLNINPKSGEVVAKYTPKRIRFRDGVEIRPVAPFLEVFAITEKHKLQPLTLD